MTGTVRHIVKSSVLAWALLLVVGSMSAQPRADYSRADSIATQYAGAPLTNLWLLAHQLTDSLPTDTEKFRALHTWVCQNITNDHRIYERNKRMRLRYADDPARLQAWNARLLPLVRQRLVDKRKTICTGYAYLLQNLASQVGIRTEMIPGYGRSAAGNVGGPGWPDHHWNAVWLDSAWYLCDPTWSSGTQHLWGQQGPDPYFLADPARFALNHYPLDTAWLLLDHAPTLRQFLDAPLVYHAGQREEIVPLVPNAFWLTSPANVPVVVQFQAGTSPPADLELYVVNQRGEVVTEKIMHPQPTEGGTYTIRHTFVARGTYLLHLRQQGQYLLTYEVKIGEQLPLAERDTQSPSAQANHPKP